MLLVRDVSGKEVALLNGNGEKYEISVGVAESGLPALTIRDAADRLTLSGKVVYDNADERLFTATFSAPALTGYDAVEGFYYFDVALTFRNGHAPPRKMKSSQAGQRAACTFIPATTTRKGG